jgi:SAM-dependent methyltransferase
MSPLRRNLYDYPEYYDIAFSSETDGEIALMLEIIRRHVPFEVRTILEPACGSGRFLIKLANAGFTTVGYDSHLRMVDYALHQIRVKGLLGKASAHIMDMRSARFEHPFDAAINPTNSLGYLLDDGDVQMHLRATGEVLKKEGIYLIQLACAPERFDPESKNEWVRKRDSIVVKTTWLCIGLDHEKKQSHQVCRMEIEDHDLRFSFEDARLMRLWTDDDWRKTIADSGVFTLEAVYDPAGKPIPLDSHISGEQGNVYWVLKKV